MVALPVVDTPIAQVFLLLLPIAFFDLPIHLQLDVVDELGRVHSSPLAVVLRLGDVGLDPLLDTIDCRHPRCLLLSKRFDARPDLLKRVLACQLTSIAGERADGACHFWS